MHLRGLAMCPTHSKLQIIAYVHWAPGGTNMVPCSGDQQFPSANLLGPCRSTAVLQDLTHYQRPKESPRHFLPNIHPHPTHWWNINTSWNSEYTPDIYLFLYWDTVQSHKPWNTQDFFHPSRASFLGIKSYMHLLFFFLSIRKWAKILWVCMYAKYLHTYRDCVQFNFNAWVWQCEILT